MTSSVREREVVSYVVHGFAHRGTLKQCPTESPAQRAVDALCLTINQSSLTPTWGQIGFETLVNHYREHELPDVFFDRKPLTSTEE